MIPIHTHIPLGNFVTTYDPYVMSCERISELEVNGDFLLMDIPSSFRFFLNCARQAGIAYSDCKLLGNMLAGWSATVYGTRCVADVKIPLEKRIFPRYLLHCITG